MAFFAIALALLLEQVRPLTSDHPAAVGLHRWVRLVGHNVDAGGAQHGWLAWGLAVGLPALAVPLRLASFSCCFCSFCNTTCE